MGVSAQGDNEETGILLDLDDRRWNQSSAGLMMVYINLMILAMSVEPLRKGEMDDVFETPRLPGNRQINRDRFFG